MIARILAAVLIICLAMCAGAEASSNLRSALEFAQADQPPPPPLPRTTSGGTAQDAPEPHGLRLQATDEELTPLQPAHPRSALEKAQLEALTWYMTGRLREHRNDFKGALTAYKRAIALDASAVQVYRAVIPLAFGLKRTEEAIKYAKDAVKLDPSDYLLLRRVGLHMAGQQLFPDAIRFLQQALESPRLDKKSGIFVILNRDLAILYETTGEIAKAADSLQVVFEALTQLGKYSLDFQTRAQLERNAATTYESIGQTFLKADRTQLAIRAFERAAKARKGKPGTLNYNLGQVYLRTKQFEEALQQLQQYFDAQLQSKGKDAYELLSQILKQMNKSSELIPRLETLAEKDPRNNTLQYYLAERYVATDRLQDAESLYQKALSTTDDGEGYLGLAAVYRKQNRPDELLEMLSKAFGKLANNERLVAQFGAELKAISADKTLVDGLLDSGRKRSQGDTANLDFPQSYLLAGLAVQVEQTPAAVEFFRTALKLHPRPEQALLVYQELGQHLMRMKQFAKAAEVYREAADARELSKAKVDFLYFLSQACELDGQSQTALDAVAEARKLSPEHPMLHYQEGWIYYHSHQWDKAIETFQQVMAKFATETTIVRRCQFSLSNIYVQTGDVRKGEEILEKILEESPDDPSVNNDLGYLYADQGKNLQKAEKMIRKAITAEPQNIAYIDSMGWILFKLAKYDEALPYLQKAASSPDGNDSVIWDHLGDCYQKLNQTEKAREAWKKTLELSKKEAQSDEKLVQRVEEKLKIAADKLPNAPRDR